MSTTFPRARKSKPGYNVDQVEDFLEEARRAYTADRGDLGVVTAASIRRTAFALQKAQKEMKSDPKSGKSKSGKPGEKPLIDQLAELVDPPVPSPDQDSACDQDLDAIRVALLGQGEG